MGAFRIEEADRPHLVRLLVIWIVLSAIGVLAVLQIHYPPYDQTVQGQDQSRTLALLTALATPVFIAVVMMVLYSAVFFRRTTPELVDGPPMLGNTPVQIAWVAISAIVVLFLASSIKIVQEYERGVIFRLGRCVGAKGPGVFFVIPVLDRITKINLQIIAAPVASQAVIATLASSNVAHAVGQPGRAIGQAGGQTGSGTPGGAGSEMQVQVIAQQWYFTYRYADYGGVETTHLYLPVDRPVELHITSIDIIHSFWAYQLGVKADANPGVDNIFHVTPQKTGSFQVRCAELCGLWHGNMADSEGQVVSQSAFDIWIAQQQKDFEVISKAVPSYAPYYFPEPLIKGG